MTARVERLEHRLGQAETAQESLPPPAAVQEKINSGVGLKLVNRIGALTLAIGIIFFFKYAVDNRWIGALGRVILGLILGLLLIGFADWLRKRDQSVLSQGVAGCGVASLFISIYASFAFYHLASLSAGFAGLVIVCGVALALSFVYGAVSIAALGFIGAVLTALLLHGSATPKLGLEFPYLLLVTVTAVVITLRQKWSVLMPITTGLVLIGAIPLINTAHPYAFVLFSGILAALHFAAEGRASETRVRIAFSIVAHVCVLAALTRLVALWAEHQSAPADRGSLTSELESFLLAIYGIAALSAGVWRKETSLRALGSVLLALVIAKLYLYDVWQLSRFYLVTAFIALGVILLAASFFYSRFRAQAGTRS